MITKRVLYTLHFFVEVCPSQEREFSVSVDKTPAEIVNGIRGRVAGVNPENEKKDEDDDI